ncbi:merozoite surface protein 7 [Plasmodium gonderi]|uniref:Merozoite surface protein 7 n=1 Tax=Plasmodium gonderi TaxID=77519 RepID=A0A1Y1JI77_PLAGO|nr:merozoite surface protein 7 [Plasmodium gonderi]GAW82216.1 merozoite surface protein 7 [Plasmodium gonderi]
MKGNYVVLCCFLFVHSFQEALSDKFGVPKHDNNLEQDATYMLMKKLEKLYKLSETNNGEIFNKEIESLKKQIEALKQGKVDNSGENIGQLLENESKDDSGQKTIFGMDEDDLDIYDADFIGQGKDITQGENVSDEDVEEDEVEEDENSHEGESNKAAILLSSAPSPSAPAAPAPAESTTTEVTGNQSAQPQTPPQAQPAQSQQEGSGESSQNPQQPAPPGPAATANPAGQNQNGQSPNVKYLDKLYDEILHTTDENGINVPPYHSKFNNFRKNYEFSMNEREYDIVKNLFDVCFKKDNNSNVTCFIDVFKKVLEDEKFQKQFDNFVHGLYGFAKRHNYLGGDKTSLAEAYKALFLNALSYLNTLIME